MNFGTIIVADKWEGRCCRLWNGRRKAEQDYGTE